MSNGLSNIKPRPSVAAEPPELPAPFCCLPMKHIRHRFRWFRVEGTEIWIMPCLSDDIDREWRINYCPACGKEIRNIEVATHDLQSWVEPTAAGNPRSA